jgi:hypothetical protein
MNRPSVGVNRYQMSTALMQPEGTELPTTQLLFGNGNTPGGAIDFTASTSLMATGNTHHLFDSTPPIQDDPFAESSSALTEMVDNSGNARHPAEERGSIKKIMHLFEVKTGTGEEEEGIPRAADSNRWWLNTAAKTMLS